MTALEDQPAAAAAPLPERRIDLDAARRARREKKGPAPVIIFFGNEYPLPKALPAEVIDLCASIEKDFTAVTKAMRILLGGQIYDDLLEKAKAEGDPLEVDDVIYLLEQALEIYEVTLPESAASG